MPTDVNFKTIEYNISRWYVKENCNNGKEAHNDFHTANLKCDPRDENYYTLNFIFQFFSLSKHLQSRVFVSNDLKTNRGGFA